MLVLNSDRDYIDVRATPYAHPEGIKTTPADILGNYLLGKVIAKGTKPARVIDYHLRPEQRNGLTVVLDDGQTFVLYLPTKFELVPERIATPDQTPDEIEQSDWTFWLFGFICFMAGCIATAFISW
jgi:hypothetical protein